MPLFLVTPQLCFILKLMESRIGWKPKCAETKLGGRGFKPMLYWYVILYIPYIYTINPFYNQALGDFFCVIWTCITTFHINLYKIVTIGKKNLITQFFYARIKVAIIFKNYMGYFKLYYTLLDLKKVVIFAYFNVMIYIEFEFLNY
jgi:hypothetical protein